MFRTTKLMKWQEIVGAAAEILGPLSGQKSIEDEQGRINLKPLGYIFGYLNAASVYNGINVDTEYGEAALEGIFETFWPKNGKRYVNALIANTGNSEIIDAAGIGRNDYIQKARKDAIPLGFSMCILANEKPEAKEWFEKAARELANANSSGNSA